MGLRGTLTCLSLPPDPFRPPKYPEPCPSPRGAPSLLSHPCRYRDASGLPAWRLWSKASPVYQFKRTFPKLCRLGWKWRTRSSVKITESAREENTKALHRGRESRHLEEIGRASCRERV